MRQWINIVESAASTGRNQDEEWVSGYLETINGLEFTPLDRQTWSTLRDEGLDEEQGVYEKSQWEMALLPITDADATSLQNFDDAAIERFNLFDIRLKERFHGRIVDLIDYDSGMVKLVRVA